MIIDFILLVSVVVLNIGCIYLYRELDKQGSRIRSLERTVYNYIYYIDKVKERKIK